MKHVLLSIHAVIVLIQGHGLLTLPPSKSGGTLSTPHTTPTEHFALASYGIIDKAFFDNDHSNTPWTRPGEFDFNLARDLIPGHPETLHPCGCNAGDVLHCIGVSVATGFGETTKGIVTPPNWMAGSVQEVAWNAWANHGGGDVFMLCKKTEFDSCLSTNLPNNPAHSTQAEKDAYLQCVWDCFESNTLAFNPNSPQKLQFQDEVGTYVTMDPYDKVGKNGAVFRFTPIPDSLQVTNGGEGKCMWDNVIGFSNDKARTEFIASFGVEGTCDSGRDSHNPYNWHVVDKVKIPTDMEVGEYLLSWRWDAYTADQMWTNCADVKIVSGSPSPPSPSSPSSLSPTIQYAPPPSSSDGEDSRMIAYLGNWDACPTANQLEQYTHIVIAFAVTYTWNPSKNICNTDCAIGSPVPICNNAPNPSLVSQWQRMGIKVILSFGGAGMGGSWAGDVNDCWDYCFGKEASVISQLDIIVRNQNFDGVDIDYEYFHSSPAQQHFLKTVTVGLKNTLPSGSIITHAPMDPDLVAGGTYYNALMDVAWTLDFLMPQYYNGHTRPVLDGLDGTGAGSMSALSHYSNLIDEMFKKDPTKVIFGFCISDCGGTNSNANGLQAQKIMTDLSGYYSCNGGAFFWVVSDDVSGSWSSVVNTAIKPSVGCSSDGLTPPPSIPRVPTAHPSSLPTKPRVPTSHPSSFPTNPTAHPTSHPSIDGYEISTDARCGTSELDARGNCRKTCVHNNDCDGGMLCWNVHSNYCGSKPDPNCVFPPQQDSSLHRCGLSELDSRELCGTPCTYAGDCTAPGEDCYAVNLNYCGCKQESPPSAPLVPTSHPSSHPSIEGYEISTEPRCGTSELDARENCREICFSNADCDNGLLCWGVLSNYCGSKPDLNCAFPPQQSSSLYRCGTSEIDARELCGIPCMYANDCIVPGEACWGVHSNYCGCEREANPDSTPAPNDEHTLAPLTTGNIESDDPTTSPAPTNPTSQTSYQTSEPTSMSPSNPLIEIFLDVFDTLLRLMLLCSSA